MDPSGEPDIVLDCRSLKEPPTEQFDAVYFSHNLEHYPRHNVPKVLTGFLNVLKAGGFAQIRVPDLGELIRGEAQNGMELDQVLYVSPMGPIPRWM